MKYNKGDRVKHPKRDDWGLGEVLADSDGGSVRIFLLKQVRRPYRWISFSPSRSRVQRLRIRSLTT